MEAKDTLEAPCTFCGYNGRGYWQPATHDKHCPWFDLGGYEERKQALRDTIKSISVTSKICFKAGRESMLKEVVDWLNSVEVAHDVLGAVRFYASRKEYKAKLKEWGIDEKETR